MKNKVVIILALSWCSLNYGMKLEQKIWDKPVDTMHIKGFSANTITITESDDNKFCYCMASNNVIINEIKNTKTVVFDFNETKRNSSYHYIWVPRGAVIKKIIDLKKGSIEIAGKGQIEGTVHEGNLSLAVPTLSGNSNIVVSNGDVDLLGLNNAHVDLDITVKKKEWLKNFAKFKLRYTWSWLLWPEYIGRVNNSPEISHYPQIKIWAKTGIVALWN